MIEARDTIKNLKRIKDFGSDRYDYLRLDKNERIIPFPGGAFAEMIGGMDSKLLTMYPDQTTLYKKLSGFLKIREDELLLTNGSDAALKSIYEVYVEKGDEVCFLHPTYALVEVYADMFGARKTKIEFDDDLKLNFDRLLDSIGKDTRACIIANPNQPTGTVIPEEKLTALMKKTYETDTLLVLDEAYIEFSNQNSAVRLINTYDNLIVLRTFSKAFGLASARLGYIISNKANIENLYKVKTLADINLLAIKCAEYLLDNYRLVTGYVREVNESIEYIAKETAKLGIRCIKGHTNFLHLKFDPSTDTKYIADELKKSYFLVRTGAAGLPAVIEGCIRITVGPRKEMELFIHVLNALLQRKAGKDM